MHTMSPADAKRGLSLKGSLIIVLIAAAVAYIGYSALRGALDVRRDNAEFARDSGRVMGRIVSHVLYTDTSAQRKSWYRPVVAYSVGGREREAVAWSGVDLTKSLTEFKVGVPIEVAYLRERPEVARVAGFGGESWVGLAIFGFLMLVLPLIATGWGIWKRHLFARL